MGINFGLRTSDGDLVCRVNHSACTVPEHLLDESIQEYSWVGYCVECSMVNRDACEVCGLELDVTGHNAIAILERLGIEVDPREVFGQMDPAEMLGRSLTGNVGRSDDGVPWSERRGSGGGLMVDCGVSPGYYDRTFGVLAELATAAMERSCVIAWG